MNNTNTSKLISETEHTVVADVELGLDAKGRRVGVIVWAWEVVFAPTEENHEGRCWSLAPGRYFVMSSAGLRNGRGFGAYRYPRYFSTKAELDAAVAACLKSATKTAAKNAAKNAAE